jgi:hypothetical protein
MIEITERTWLRPFNHHGVWIEVCNGAQLINTGFRHKLSGVAELGLEEIPAEYIVTVNGLRYTVEQNKAKKLVVKGW